MSHITNIKMKPLNNLFSKWRRAVKGAIIRSFSVLIVAAAVLLGLLTIPAMAATTLSTGDIAFIGINTDGDDDFAFVLLKDISAGTSIKFTDKGWNDGAGFFTVLGDGIWEWSTASDLPAGTIVHIKTTNDGIIEAGSLAASPGTVAWYENNSTVISYAGDQVFLYQGDEATPTIIAGIHWNVEAGTTTGNWDGSATSAMTSALPDQLTNGVNAIWVYQAGPTEKDNFRYNGSTTSGTPSELRTAIYNLNNWDVDDTNTTAYTLNPFPCSFSVTVPPAISSASYSANTGALIVSGTNFEAKIGAANDITVSKLTLQGEGGTTYTLTSSDVEIDSAAQFTVNLNATDLAAVNQIINKNGTSSTGGTTYNLAVADDWCANVTDGDISDTTIALTVSNVAVPAIASAAYDAETGVLAVTGTSFFVLSGAANDIVTNKFTITGQGEATYTLTSASVEITSGTSFAVTLNATDKAAVNLIVNKNGTSSIDGTTYNLAAAEDWAAGVDAAVNVADLTGNGITVSNVVPDETPPTATVALDDTALKVGDTATVTITFSETVSGFANDDLTIPNGAMTPVGSADGNITFTATYTPTADVEDATNVIALAMTGVTDIAGNAGSGTASSPNYAIDTHRPTATVALDDTALKAGDTATVTITFSEAVSGFANDDLTIPNGTMTPVGSADGNITFTATYTPTADVEDNINEITLAMTGVTDIAGNAGVGTASSPNFAIDTNRPTATIVLDDTALKAGDTATVTITFSEAVSGFANDDLTIPNGTMTPVGSADGNITFTATYTPTADVEDNTNEIVLNMTGVTNISGNAGTGTASSPNFAIDTNRPTTTIVLDDTALKTGDTATVTITFSEAVSGFANDDLTIPNGTMTPVGSADGNITFTATYTPTADVEDATNVIALAMTGVTDIAGNTGAGTASSPNYAIDTHRPTATVALDDTALKAGDIATVTITFSEAVSGFANDDLTIPNGTMTPVGSADGNITFTATYTPTADVKDNTNEITLNMAGVSDIAGNAGTGTASSANFAIDTNRPTATIVLDDTALKAGDTATVTITFSEAVSGFANEDLTIPNGTMTPVGSADGNITFTATYTPTADVEDNTNEIVLNMTGVINIAGNAGTGMASSANFSIDTKCLTATISLDDTALKVGETATVTITFSEAVSGFANDDLTIPNGTMTPVGSADGNITFTATYTPTADIEDVSNVIVLAMIGVTDIAGNAGTGTASSANFAIDTRVPTISNVTSTKDDGTYGIGETIVITVGFSETVTVTGTPQLLLETGTVDRTVNYSSGSGSSNLNFSYTTQAGDESDDLDYASTSALTGTIKDVAGNDATLTLPSPGAANSLGANKAILVKAFPSVSLSASSSSIAEDGGSSTITATLSQAYGQNVTVSLSFTGTATNITDYTRSADSITVIAGATSGSIIITGIDDAVDDDNETIIVDMTGGSNCIENGIQQITVTINEAPDIPAAPALQSAAAGDRHVNVSWSSVSGAAGYKVFASTTSGAYTTPAATVADSVYSCDVAGLTNGTTYYFVVKATNAGGDSANSNELSATPQAAALGAPIIQSAVAGDRHVNLSWSTVLGVTGYKVFSSTISGNYTTPATTVAGSVYSCDVTELINGTTYYFVVKASNAGGDSANSNEVSATPKTVPGAPSNITATAGNGYAAVSFTAPADDGGSPVTGYLMTSNPGNITATGTGTSITITGLTNGTAYTFTVKAVNAVGNGPDSTASNAVTPHRPSDGDSAPSTPTTPPTSNPGIEILVNGEAGNAGTVTTSTEGEITTTIITIDSQKIEQKLEAQGNHATVTIPVNTQADVVISEINGQTIKNMESKEAILEIKTEGVTYTLPAAQINIDDVLRQIGQEVELKDIKVSVKIAEPSAETVKIVEDTANKNNYQIVVRPIEFEITCTSGDKTVDVSRFNAYIERTIAIPEGIDPDKITTGVVLNADGTFSPVLTTIVNLNGKYFVKIKSLSNSTYAVIYNHQEFKDVEKHWAKEAINDMGSRLIISGVGNDMFEPDRDISRAEFAAIMVRALGLKTGLGKNPFSDVPDDAWYCSSIMTAVEYKIVNGYGNGKFGPLDKITREQAMTMIANAMNTTRLQTELSESEFKTLFSSLEIEGEPVDWAKNSVAVCIKTGVVEKNDGDIKIIKGNISRGEVAVTVRRLLQKSKLI